MINFLTSLQIFSVFVVTTVVVMPVVSTAQLHYVYYTCASVVNISDESRLQCVLIITGWIIDLQIVLSQPQSPLVSVPNDKTCVLARVMSIKCRQCKKRLMAVFKKKIKIKNNT